MYIEHGRMGQLWESQSFLIPRRSGSRQHALTPKESGPCAAWLTGWESLRTSISSTRIGLVLQTTHTRIYIYIFKYYLYIYIYIYIIKWIKNGMYRVCADTKLHLHLHLHMNMRPYTVTLHTYVYEYIYINKYIYKYI